MSKDTDVKQKLEHLIIDLSNAFIKENESKHIEWLKQTLIANDFLDIENPEEFSLILFSTTHTQEDMLLNVALRELTLNKDQLFKLGFLYQKYDFLERHLEIIIEKYEGISCSSDKSRWLLHSYKEYILSLSTSDVKIPIIEEKKFWHPKRGEVKDWIDWIDSMVDLYYGEIDKYIEIKNKLIKTYQ